MSLTGLGMLLIVLAIVGLVVGMLGLAAIPVASALLVLVIGIVLYFLPSIRTGGKP